MSTLGPSPSLSLSSSSFFLHHCLFFSQFISFSSSSFPSSVLWTPPTLPITDLIFSPCTFPLIYPFRRTRHHHHKATSADRRDFSGDDSLCHVHPQAPFICDLHRALNLHHHRDQLSLARVYQKHLPFLHKGVASFVVLLVRQLIQPISALSVSRNNSEFQCLFRIPCEPMTAETVQKFVKSTKVFLKLYASALFTRWIGSSQICEKHPRVLALVLLDGLIANPKRVTAVTLYTDNYDLMPYIANTQVECTNMLLQGVPLVEVLRELTDQVGYAYRQFYLLKDSSREKPSPNVPDWAWKLAIAAVVLAFLALVVEWLVVRRVPSRKIRAPELGNGINIKAVIKSKTHMIF